MKPNKAPEPTPGSVTPRARDSACDFERRDGARVAPAPVVAHLYVSHMGLTFSRLAAKMLQQRDPNVSVTGFAGTMRRLLAELEGDTEYVDAIWHHNRPRFIPDAFALDRKKQQVVVYEIEDTHLLSLKKLGRMMAFYWWLEYHHWDLRVLVANRYGQVTNEVNLAGYFYASESPDVKRERSDVLTRAQLRELQTIHPLEHEKFIKRCLDKNRKRANKAPEPTPTAVPR